LGGTKNLHRAEVAKDVVNSILKTRANESGPGPATYWSKEEQEKLLDAAFQKWAKRGNIWSVASESISKGAQALNGLVRVGKAW
jgi:hypothetical protein